MLFKPEYVTEATAGKIVFATGSVGVSLLVDMLCSPYPTFCAVGQEFKLIFFLVGMMALDMVTGAAAARSRGERIRSRRLGEGLKRKVAMLAVVGGGVLAAGALQTALGLTATLPNLVYVWLTAWFIGVEFLSLYENADSMGLNMPAFMKVFVEKALQKVEEQADRIIPSNAEKENEFDGPDTGAA